MKLITEKGLNGYRLSDIRRELMPSRFKKFAKWINGQTVGIFKGESIVYEHDWERFLKGLPDAD